MYVHKLVKKLHAVVLSNFVREMRGEWGRGGVVEGVYRISIIRLEVNTISLKLNFALECKHKGTATRRLTRRAYEFTSGD